jgi:hypothetical protein
MRAKTLKGFQDRLIYSPDILDVGPLRACPGPEAVI